MVCGYWRLRPDTLWNLCSRNSCYSGLKYIEKFGRKSAEERLTKEVLPMLLERELSKIWVMKKLQDVLVNSILKIFWPKKEQIQTFIHLKMLIIDWLQD
uniref:Uncharacterized protein n=1 Tax=Ditylenchus dipsaci TaxID=166011 RepID=A0A915CT01_9BILA